MARKVGPLIDLKQKLGDLQVRHESEGFLFELLRLLGHRFLQGTYFEQLTRNFCIRQFTLTRESIDLVQLLLEECKTRLQITVAVYLNGDWESLRVLQLGETLSPQQIRFEVLELARTGHPHVTGPQPVFKLGQHRQFIKRAIRTGLGEDMILAAYIFGE